MTSAAGGLLIALGTDLALQRGMLLGVCHILQLRWSEKEHCWEECDIPALLLLWAVLAAVGVVIQGHMSGLISPVSVLRRCGLCGMRRDPYTRIVGQDRVARDGVGLINARRSTAAAGSMKASAGEGVGGGAVGTRAGAGPVSKRKTWTYSVNQHAWNYFDMESLPRGMDMYRESIFVAAEALANTFGFQDDSVRNQVEHLMMLLSNHRRYVTEMPITSLSEASLPPRSAMHSLHRKLFRNYMDWCESVRAAPLFITVPQQAESYGGDDKTEEDAMAVNLMLWLCIWGEAGNLRHLPECLCFLYHKMMQARLIDERKQESRNNKKGDYLSLLGTDYPTLYGGYFLDHVVTPIYEVIVTKSSRSDHISNFNYDDFNEFFWTPSCLRFSYRSDDSIDASSAFESGAVGVDAPSSGNPVISVAVGMENAPKTFMEKRSMLSTALCFHRVLEFHALTFQLCAVVAYARMMVVAFDLFFFIFIFLQMASSVFWTANFLGIVWTILEVWQAFPGIQMNGTAKCGFIVRLCLRYLVLVYQSLYFMWSTQHDQAEAGTQDSQAQTNHVFWWWQYLWLSFAVMVPYAFECLQQIFPPVSTWVFMFESDYLQALLNICYPISRIYVGKRVDESVGKAFKYMFFWGTLLAWKMYFSYTYEVLILVLPSVQLYDDYVNYPNTSYWGMFTLILLRWLPQMAIYLIDSSIWFALWSAMTGSIVGFQARKERLGEVRDFPSIRRHFMQIPAVFCSKVICAGVASCDTSSLDIASQNGDAGNHVSRGSRYSSAERESLTGEAVLTEASRLLESVKDGIDNNRRQTFPRETVREFLDIRTQKWATFAAVWNEVINNMRRSDVISNAEQGILKFHSFAGFAKPVYLPIFQTAGSVELAMSMIAEYVRLYDSEEDPARKGNHEAALRKAISEDVTVNEALSEVWELGVWLIRQLLGPMHDADMVRTVQVFNEFIDGKKAMDHLRLQELKTIVADITSIVSVLHHSLPKRKTSKSPALGRRRPSPAPELGRGVSAGSGQRQPSLTKSISTSGLSLLASGGDSGVGAIGGVSSGLATEGRRAGMVGAHSSSSSGQADSTRDAVRDKLRPLFNNVRMMLKSTDQRGTEVIGRLSYTANIDNGFMWDDAYASERLDCMAQDKMTLFILEKLHGLVGINRNDAEPQSVEARRRLAFFVNSLFMDMPRAPPVGDMMSWSCVTPFYSEDVIYSRSDLEQKNEDGLTTLMYMQALYKHDWRNFMEREGIGSEQQAMSRKHIESTRLWASFRAQTLARTVEGMMYYEAALRLLARLERVREDQLEDLVVQKFQYVVACQVYGHMKKKQDAKADDIETLLKRFPYLRVAYIDEVRAVRDSASPSMEYFSVLIKAGHQQEAKAGYKTGQARRGHRACIQEVYRVKLPGNPVVGEGKPENQNHAMIFSRGEHVQAIDMNQEGYFEEALKMRCLLEEFRRGTPVNPTVIVGFREHIFTGSVSSLANYMALQELSFVTLGQRVLSSPLRVRMHYGHPDLFDKVFFMAAGGVSKASKGINLSEDIFAGYNGTIRGGKVSFREYVQVGKGRDVGMQQIYKFEAKLAQGAAEQTLSRDVSRLGDRLDFFRLMSFYFGGLGYYVGNFITVLTVTFVVYFILALAIFNEEAIGDRKVIPEGNLQMMLAGMGLLNTMPMLATLTVEKGILVALGEVLQVFLSGGPMYFMFHIQTRAHYFYQTLLAGGAQYRATGRGFVIHHSHFDDIYRFFANSHFYLGFELMAALSITAALTTSKQYLGITWSLWLACLSFLFAPFWFNPLSFHWGKVVQDYKIWMRWMTGTGGNSSNSWEVWWREETSYLSKFSLAQNMQLLVRPLTYLVIGYGIGGPQVLALDNDEKQARVVVLKVVVLAAVLMVVSMATQLYGSRLSPWLRRSVTILISTFAVVYGMYLVLENTKYGKVAVGVYYVGAALSSAGLLMGFKAARSLWYLHDMVIGHFFFIILILLAALQIPSTIQTWLLFHNALSEGVVIDDILKYARMSKEQAHEVEDSLEEDHQLRRLVQSQTAELEILRQRLFSTGGANNPQFMGVGGIGGGMGGGIAGSIGGEQGGESAPGLLAPTSSGGYSYIMKPLGGESPAFYQASAGMMHASNSTLDLADLAQAKGSDEGPQSQAFKFTSPIMMPPR
ncbi:unnamed protein product [Ascophyllum nodosum]